MDNLKQQIIWFAVPVAMLLGGEKWVEAGSIIQIQNYRITQGNFTARVDLTFNQFDPSLGSLTDVRFTLQSQVDSASIDFENRGTAPGNSLVGIGYIVGYIGPNLPANTFDSLDIFPSRTLAFEAFDGNPDFSGPDSFAFRQASPVGHTISASPSALSPYIGIGVIPIEIVGNPSTGTSGLSDLSVRINGNNLSGTISLEYDFIPAAIPEPTSLGLMGTGLLGSLGACWLRRVRPAWRQKRKSAS